MANRVSSVFISYDAGGCRTCGVPAVQAHRIIPGELGGQYEYGNTVRLCPNCHVGIHVLMDWMRERSIKGRPELVAYYHAMPIGEFYEQEARPQLVRHLAKADKAFAEVMEKEPYLEAVLDRVACQRWHPKYCANAVWYGYTVEGVKAQLSKVIGIHRVKPCCPELKTSEAYDLVTRVLYGLMPPCGECNCL